VHNTGAAYGFLDGVDFPFKTVLLTTVATVALIALGVYAARLDKSQPLTRLGLTLVIGGAIGNLIDRAVYGHVIDYILFHTPVWSFAIFNLADAFISVGAALVVFDEFIGWRREAKPQSPDA